MKKLLSCLLLFALSLLVTACSTRPPLVYDGSGCIAYEELIHTKTQILGIEGMSDEIKQHAIQDIALDEDGQNLSDPDLNAAFRKSLNEEFAKKGLRMCGEGETSEYRLIVNEMKSKIHNGMTPGVSFGDVPFQLLTLEVASEFALVYGKDAYHAGRGIDYNVNNSVDFIQGRGRLAPKENINSDLRKHFQEPAENYHEYLVMFYQELAKELAEDVADIAAK